LKAWIFQGKPERYPLQKKLIERHEETWLVTRFREKMSKDDIVLLWSSGERDIRGLYGWGVITENSPNYYENWGYGVAITYKVRFKNHISISKIEEKGILKENLIMKMPIGTNFELTKDETNAVLTLIRECGETAPSLTMEGKK
jgi:hypothetical protein